MKPRLHSQLRYADLGYPQGATGQLEHDLIPQSLFHAVTLSAVLVVCLLVCEEAGELAAK